MTRGERLGNWIAHELDERLCRVCGELIAKDASFLAFGCHHRCFMSPEVVVSNGGRFSYHIKGMPELRFKPIGYAKPCDIIPFKT